MRPDWEIAVIGAGLGGLVAAALLERRGFRVRVYEQAPAFERLGAGINLSPNVMKVLRAAGVEAQLLEIGLRPEYWISRKFDTGETMFRYDMRDACEAAFGACYMVIHRGDFHEILTGNVAPGTIAFGKKLVALERKGRLRRARIRGRQPGRGGYRDRRRRHRFDGARGAARPRAAGLFGLCRASLHHPRRQARRPRPRRRQQVVVRRRASGHPHGGLLSRPEPRRDLLRHRRAAARMGLRLLPCRCRLRRAARGLRRLPPGNPHPDRHLLAARPSGRCSTGSRCRSGATGGWC